MIYVGIDIAKHDHYCAITNELGEILYKPFLVKNDLASFKDLELILSQYPISEIRIGYESTAHYANNLSYYFLNKGYHCQIINPYRTAHLRKIIGNPNSKNDKIDSLHICQAVQLNLGSSVSRNVLMSDLKSLCLSYQNTMTSRSRAKIQLVSYLDYVFPELASYFKGNPHINTAYQLLKKYPLPADISKTRLTTLTNLLSTNSHGRYKADKATELKSLAKNSIGISSSSVGFQIQLAISQIEFYTKQLEDVRDKISVIMTDLDSPIMSIVGINTVMAAMILSSIKDINFFSAPCKLISFAGLNSRVIQSGQFQASSTRMSKHGSSLLRYALIYSAHNLVKNNRTFNDFYILKRSQGKSHWNALGHCATKLTRIIFKLLSEDISFDLA